MNMTGLIRDWHARELQADYGLAGTDMVMGCPLWGDDYTSDFLNYCLPSLVANGIENCAVVLFVDGPTEHRLQGLGLRTIRLPDEISNRLPAEGHWKYPLLAAVHNLLIHQAGRANAGFHMLVADAVYSDRYFENLSRLAKTHAAIAHTGFAIVRDAGLPMLEGWRRHDGRLQTPAYSLGCLGWDHLNPQWASWTMNGITDFAEMPNSHYIHWRGQNSVRIHCAHQSAAWISPERCKKVTPALGGTVDSELPRYMAGDFYQPTLADEMTYLCISASAPPTPRIPFAEFRKEFWRFIGDNRAFLPYFTKPCVVPAPLDESAPSDDELDARLARMMERLEEGRTDG